MEHIPNMYYPPEESFRRLSHEEQIREYIQSFYEPAMQICKQLKEAFESERYSHIFGVDTSGRLPALLIHRFSKELAAKCNLPTIPCHFMPPNMDSRREQEISRLLKNETTGKHVLVVDDTIMKGRTLFSATEILREVGIPFDIAVFISYVHTKESLANEAEYMEADQVFVGMEDYISNGVHDDEPEKYPVKISTVNGIERLKGPLHFGEKETVIKGDEDLQNEVNIARAALFELADEIAKELLT